MRKLFTMLLANISLATAHAHAQAPSPPDHRKVHKADPVALVATASFPLAAVAPAAPVVAPVTTAVAFAARPVTPTTPGTGPATACVAAAVVVPPNNADSVGQAGNTIHGTEPKYPLRPDPGRHHKGYNYR